ncbi:hypothetical protein SAMN06309944_1950 [Micrococcales bacterium KH10]|nr:hypothetical protein SAMN06309944_1950 [Micrococcales bacterium KH10]
MYSGVNKATWNSDENKRGGWRSGTAHVALICAALIATSGVAAVAGAGASSAGSLTSVNESGSMTVDQLTQTGDDQQRWLSVPNSRMVLHPYDYPRGGPELVQHQGPTLPMDVGVFAHDDAIRIDDVLELFHADETDPPATQMEATTTPFHSDMDSAEGGRLIRYRLLPAKAR